METGETNLRFSAGAKALMPRLKELNLEHFAKWFFEQSNQVVVGSGTFTEYFQYLDSLKEKNGN